MFVWAQAASKLTQVVKTAILYLLIDLKFLQRYMPRYTYFMYLIKPHSIRGIFWIGDLPDRFPSASCAAANERMEAPDNRKRIIFLLLMENTSNGEKRK